MMKHLIALILYRVHGHPVHDMLLPDLHDYHFVNIAQVRIQIVSTACLFHIDRVTARLIALMLAHCLARTQPG